MSLSVLVAAIEEGSIAAAGRRLGISAVMAGRYLTALEEHLSARLVQRTTRGLSMTDAGHAFFARAKRILEDLSEAEDEAADRQSKPRGNLRIAAPITFGTMYLGPVVAEYLNEFPAVHVSLHLQDRFVDLVEEGMDLALRIGTLPDSDLVARKLADCRLIACASPKYLAGAGPLKTPADLASHALIGYIGEVNPARWTFVDRDGQQITHQSRCRFMANNTGLMAEAALAGCGIAYGPIFSFAKYLASGELIAVLPTYSNPILPLHVITPSAKHVNAKTRLFMEVLRRTFGQRAPWEH